MNTAPYRATSHEQWFDALQDEAFRLLNGQPNAPWALLAETALSLIPIHGQVAAAYDTLHALNAVNTAPRSKATWFELFSALIGLLPDGGEVVKCCLHAMHNHAMPCNWLLYPIRQHYRGNVEALVRSTLQLSQLQTLLARLLNAPSIQQQINNSTRQQFQAIEHGLAKHFDAFKHQVERWLNEGAALNAQADFGGGQWVHPYPSQPPQTIATTAAPTDNAAALASVGTPIRASADALADTSAAGTPTTSAASNSDTGHASSAHFSLDLSLHDAWLAPIPDVPYVLIFNDGTQYEGKLDAQGQAHLHGVPPVPAQVYYGQDPRPPQARVEMPANNFQANSSTNEEAIANIQRYLADSEVFWTQQASTEQKEVFDDLNNNGNEGESLWNYLSEEQQRALRQKIEQDDHA